MKQQKQPRVCKELKHLVRHGANVPALERCSILRSLPQVLWLAIVVTEKSRGGDRLLDLTVVHVRLYFAVHTPDSAAWHECRPST